MNYIERREARHRARCRFLSLVATIAVVIWLIAGVLAITAGLAIGTGVWDPTESKPTTYRVPSAAMEPTYELGDVVAVDRDKDAEVGDVIIFYPPAGAVAGGAGECGVATTIPGQPCTRPTEQRADVIFIKRVVAGPGDTVAIRDGQTVLNGEVQDEPFTAPCGSVGECSFPRPFKVPPDHVFTLGDNRGASDDSRFWGPVPRQWIVGVVED